MATVAMTQTEFVSRSKQVHGKKFSYDNVEYVSTKLKVMITCPEHGDWQQLPAKHLRGQGCKKCEAQQHSKRMTDRVSVSKSEFLLRARSKFGERFKYSKYHNLTTEFEIKCAVHGKFYCTPTEHLRLKQGCPACTNNRLTTKQFVEKAMAVHGTKYAYSRTVCSMAGIKVLVTCTKHGDFYVLQRHHLSRRQGCPGCSSAGHSQIAIKWLEFEARRRRMKDVWHAENGGEYVIPGTALRVDGFHERTNTIFEFYGDAYHGNLKRYTPESRPSPFDKSKTAKQLYTATMKREKKLIAMGYKVISIWEKDFKALLK